MFRHTVKGLTDLVSQTSQFFNRIFCAKVYNICLKLCSIVECYETETLATICGSFISTWNEGKNTRVNKRKLGAKLVLKVEAAAAAAIVLVNTAGSRFRSARLPIPRFATHDLSYDPSIVTDNHTQGGKNYTHSDLSVNLMANFFAQLCLYRSLLLADKSRLDNLLRDVAQHPDSCAFQNCFSFRILILFFFF